MKKESLVTITEALFSALLHEIILGAMYVCEYVVRMYSEYLLICRNSFSKNMVDYTGLVWINWTFIDIYLYIILVLGICGRLKGLADKAVAD